MPELDTQIRDYIEATSTQLTVGELLEDHAELAPRVIVPPQPHWRGWLIAGAAMVIVLAVFGLLTIGSGVPDVPPADIVPTTTPALTPTTSPQLESSSPGRLVFTVVDRPNGDFLNSGVWFGNAFYALGQSGTLYSTSEGLSWKAEEGFEMSAGVSPTTVVARDDRLVVLGSSEPDSIGSVGCSQPGDIIEVNVLDLDGSWTTSQIDLPLTRPSSQTGCISFYIGEIAVGPTGIMVGGSIAGELPFEAIIADVLGEEALDTLNEVRPEGDVLVVVWQDGARTDRIDLTELGLSDQINEFAAYARDLIGSTEGDNTWFGESPMVWFSPDGQTWSQVDSSGGPMGGHQIETVVATRNGFIVRSDNGAAFKTTDGSSWETSNLPQQDIFIWRGQTVVIGESGVTPVDDPGQVLIPVPSEIVSAYKLYVGEMGIIGGGSDGDFGPDFPTAEPITFSFDGTNWETWLPQEFEKIEDSVGYLGMGDDFVIFYDWSNQELWIGTPESGGEDAP